MRLRQGTFWFPEVPADASAFAAIVSFPGDFAPARRRQQWQFTTPAPLHRLQLALAFAHFTLPITGKNQAPLANAAVSGLLECVNPAPTDYWTPDAELPLSVLRTFRHAVTDGHGNFSAGLVPCQHYALALTVGGQTGAPVQITAGASGALARPATR